MRDNSLKIVKYLHAFNYPLNMESVFYNVMPLVKVIIVTSPGLKNKKNQINKYPGIQFRLPCTPQDNFSWVPNCSLGPPGWETRVS